MQRLNLALLLTLLLSVPSFGQTLPTFWSGLSKPVCTNIAIEQASPEVGDTLTVDSTWTGSPFELQTKWYVNDVLAYTGSSFNTSGVTTTNDVVHVVQYGINAAGVASRMSTTVTMLEGDDPPPLVAPTNTVAPSITGTPTPGYTLTGNAGSWTASPTSYSYQWTADNSNISGETSSTYVVQEGDLGKAIRVVVTATNATGTGDPATSSAKTITAAITIDSSWLTENGPAPFYLNQSGKTYVLDTDVTTDGTAFAIIAKDVTFDLNDHTVTYNNAAPITIPNGSFETGSGTSATGWNFANAPSASRYQGVWIYNETYDGDYSLKFSDTKTNQYITSTSTITLEPNTTYSLSAMFEYGGKGTASNPGVKAYVRLIGTGGETTREVSRSTGNSRGIQLQEGVFTTGATAETYTLQVGIEGHESGSVPFYIDDIKIQKTYNYGVVVGPQSWGPGLLPDVSQYGSGTGATIKNGTITQGEDGGTWSHGIFIYSSTNVLVDKLDITVRGANCSVIYGYNMTNNTVTVINNTLRSNVRTVTSRDSGHGAMVDGLIGEFAYNTFLNGPHFGLNAVSSSTAGSHIHHNSFILKTKYTNAFAIVVNDKEGVGSLVYDNVINSTGADEASAGILVQGVGPTKVYNNTIDVKLLANNQEYQGPQYNGAYALQLERAQNKEIYGNTVTVYSDAADGTALRLTTANDVNISNNYIHDNTFAAVRTSGTMKIAAISFSDILADSNNRIEDNIFKTDTILIGGSSITDGFVLDGNSIEFTGANPADFRMVEVIDWDPSKESRAVKNLEFRDTTYIGASTRSLMENGDLRQLATQNPMIYSSAFISWTTTIQVKDASNNPLSGASVTIKDKDNNTVFTGTTDASGEAVAVIKQQQVQGNTKTTYNDHTVTVTKSGYTFTPVEFAADETQTITVTAE